MIYVFEDKKDDMLSEFFRKAYPSDIANKFIYANGNGYLLGIVQQMLKSTQETIVVFLDFYPTNRSIVDIYRNICRESK